MAVVVASTPVTNLYGVKPGNLGGQMSLRIFTPEIAHTISMRKTVLSEIGAGGGIED